MDAYREHFQHLGPPSTGGHTPDDVQMLESLKDAMLLSSAKNVLEIGFNRGGSALAFLLNGANLTSNDVTDNPVSVEYLTKTFGTQFTFVHAPSDDLIKHVGGQQFDLVYIDGDHGNDQAARDVDTCLALGIPYLLFDDSFHGAHENIRNMITHGANSGHWTIVKEYEVGCGKTLVKVVK